MEAFLSRLWDMRQLLDTLRPSGDIHCAFVVDWVVLPDFNHLEFQPLDYADGGLKIPEER